MTTATASLSNASTTDEATTLMVPQPQSVEETGIELSFLVDLMLKTIHFAGRPTTRQLTEQLALSFTVVDELIGFLRQEQAIEIVGSSGMSEQSYQYALTERGRNKADEALKRNQYVGPTPVPFPMYVEVLRRQSVNHMRIERDAFLEAISHLVLNKNVLAALGPAVNSGQSILLYGSTGNGKSSITVALGRMLPGQVLIPYAVDVHGQIVKVFDPRVHRRMEPELTADRRQGLGQLDGSDTERRRDRRWALSWRPVVAVGGELTLQDLDLRYSPLSQFYVAPLQWKANNGVLIIDDFGRQMIKPQELLNRWIVPMEQGVDHLSLHTGDSVELPFETLLVFSSNIPPGRLGDEAFFRRIRYKVEVPNPTLEEFLEILRRVCQEKDVTFSNDGAQYLIDTYYKPTGRILRACHPRDLVDLLVDITRFYGKEPTLTPEWLDLASAAYFVDVEEAA